MKKHFFIIVFFFFSLVSFSDVQAQCNVSNITSMYYRGYKMQGEGTTQFHATSTNGELTWTIAAGQSTISSTGLVTWDPLFTGTARITATSSGACGTPVTKTTSLQVYPMPPIKW